MADNLTATAQVNAITSQPTGHFWYDRRILDRLVLDFRYLGYGEERPLPKNSGSTIMFARYANFSAATTALTEGVTPAATQASKSTIYATVSQYGAYVIVTDWAMETGVDPNIVRIIDDILADQAHDTFDQVARDVMAYGGTAQYTGTASAATDVNEPLLYDDIAAAVNSLERRGVKTIRERTQGGTNYNSFAIDAGYIGVFHTDARFDLENMTGFIKAKDYAQPGKALPGEIGSQGLLRCILSSNAPVTADQGGSFKTYQYDQRSTSGTDADVYVAVIFGRGYYGNTQIGQKSVQTITKRPDSGGVENALNQRGSVGWKGNLVTKVLDATRGITLYHSCTKLPRAETT